MLATRRTLDARAYWRHDVRLPAHVKVLGQARRACWVRNISVDGALIEFDAEVSLPAAFRLDIDDDLFEAHCAVRHHDGRRFGVQFTSNRQGALARYS